MTINTLLLSPKLVLGEIGGMNPSVQCDLSHLTDAQFQATEGNLLQFYGGPLSFPWTLGEASASLAGLVPWPFRLKGGTGLPLIRQELGLSGTTSRLGPRSPRHGLQASPDGNGSKGISPRTILEQIRRWADFPSIFEVQRELDSLLRSALNNPKAALPLVLGLISAALDDNFRQAEWLQTILFGSWESRELKLFRRLIEGMTESALRQVAEMTLERMTVKTEGQDTYERFAYLEGQMPRMVFAGPEAFLIWIQEVTEYAYLEKGKKTDDRELRGYLQWYLMNSGVAASFLGGFPSQSLRYAAWLVERCPLHDLPLDILPFVFRRIQARDLTDRAEASQREELKKLAAYYASSLPWEATFWRDYLASPYPEAYLKETFEKIQPWRCGKRLDLIDDEALRWAYAGLDHPEDLPFDRFWDKFGLRRSFPYLRPAEPFLDRPFRGEVRLREPGRAVTVDFLPSWSEADFFILFPTSEIDGKALTIVDDSDLFVRETFRKNDFQFYRMIAEGRLVGALYMERIQDNGKRQLIVFFHPRSLWEVDLDSLLDAVEGPLARIGQEERYDRVLLSAGYYNSTSAHTGPLDEAMRRRYPQPKEKARGWYLADDLRGFFFKEVNLFIL